MVYNTSKYKEMIIRKSTEKSNISGLYNIQHIKVQRNKNKEKIWNIGYIWITFELDL